MAKFRQFLSKPIVTAILLVLALALLGGGTVDSARAALNLRSEFYDSEVKLPTIGVQLLENGKAVSGKEALLTGFLGDKMLLPGKTYEEKLAVANNGTIDEFVRVTVLKYWLDPKGDKSPAMDSQWIKLGFVTDGVWTIDKSSSTEERTVLYYGSALKVGETSTLFMNSVTIDGKVAEKVTQEKTVNGSLTTITTTYDYDGYKFCIKATVDSVQTHNAQDAVKSAWGRDVTVSGDSITLK